MNETAVKLEEVSKFYKLYRAPVDRLKEALNPFAKKYHQEFYALKRVCLEVRHGEILGIVGRNGSGKSTLLKLVAGVIQPNGGHIAIQGSISALLDMGAGLNPDFTGIQNILFGGIMMGFSREEIQRKMGEIVAFADIGEFIHQPLKTYSSGMRARLGFSLAVTVKPQILIIDEVLGVGDELFRKKCFDKMQELIGSGCTVLFVSHNPQSIEQLCTRALLLDRGEVILDGPPTMVSRYYQKLLFSLPEIREETRNEIILLNGDAKAKTTYQVRKDQFNLPPVPAAPAGPPAKAEAEARHAEICAFFLSGLKPESMVRSDLCDITFDEVFIHTLAGERVNVLVMNETYRVSYTLRFGVEAHQIRLATSFQDVNGLRISTYAVEPEGLGEARIGDRFLVQFQFKCLLLPGTYFISLSVSGENGEGERMKLQHVHDAAVFKVQATKEQVFWGLVSLQQNGQIARIE